MAVPIGLISFLNRREELIVPSWLFESITTGSASPFWVETSRIWPMKQLLFMLAPRAAIQITPCAVVTLEAENAPRAILLLPVVLPASAVWPIAVLLSPVVLLSSAALPIAVLLLPLMLLSRARAPCAVLLAPALLLRSAAAPVAVFWSAVFTRRVPAPMAVLKPPVVSPLSEKNPDRKSTRLNSSHIPLSR